MQTTESKEESAIDVSHQSHDSQRIPFYLVESDYDKCTIPDDPITQIKAGASVTKLEYGVKWIKQPKTCIITKKHHDKQISHDFLQLANWLSKEKDVTVYVLPEVHEKEFPQFKPFDVTKMGENIDFMVVLGGDGTLLYLAGLFQGDISIPPVISFARGSLGFLTPFEYKSYPKILNTFLSPMEPHWINIRMRLRAKVFRKKRSTSMKINLSNEQQNETNCNIYDVEDEIAMDNCDYECVYDTQGANEVLIERAGSVSTMIMLELHVNRKKVTYVQADGLIISTPTGSTAYSVSAGGSLIAPNVPCIGLTPICPHTLSFRPVVVADSSTIHITIPHNARTYPKITLDGKFAFILQRGDIVQIYASKYPLSTFKLNEYQHEWWGGLVEKFNWNVRELQK